MHLMIRKIEFDNFYSFKDKQVIDFTTSKKKGGIYYTSFDGVQITKVMGLIGPNNSGKTNVAKLFGFLKFFFTVPTRDETESEDTGYKAYEFGDNGITKIKVEFETDQYLCLYNLELCPKKIFREKMEIKKLQKYSKFITLFDRDDGHISVNNTYVKGVTKKRLESIKKDVSVIAFIQANYEIGVIAHIYDYFDEYWANVNEGGFIFTPEDRLTDVAEIYRRIPKLKEKVDDFIKDFDLGIDGFSIQKEGKGINVEAIHKIGSKEYKLPINYESRGTKSLFVDLLHILVCTHMHGRALIIDEIEMGLHPEAVNKIVQFISEKFLDKKKQFIFASHTFDFLKKFDAQQVCLIEKNDNKSSISRLDEYDIRPDENYYRKYLSGAYGAFPKISV